jgi:hypothetical protein
MKPADARGTVGEGEETGEGWAPRVEFDREPDLNDGREEFEEIIGDADARGRLRVDWVAPGDARGNRVACHAAQKGVGEKEVCWAAGCEEVDADSIPCAGQEEKPHVEVCEDREG